MKIELLLLIPQNPVLQSVVLKRNIGAWWMLVQYCIVHPPLDYFAHASLVKKCGVETLVRLWRENSGEQFHTFLLLIVVLIRGSGGG